MKLVVKHLSRHPKSGVLRFRRAFPAHLRPYIPHQPVQLSESLRVRSIQEPGARERFEAAAARYDEIVRGAERAAQLEDKATTSGYSAITDELIEFLVAAYRAEELEADEYRRHLPEPTTRKLQRVVKAREWLELDLPWAKRVRGAGDLETMVATWTDAIIDLGLGNDIALDAKDPNFSQLVRAFHDVNIEVWEALILRLEGEKVPTPAKPVRPEASTASTSFAAMVEALLDNALFGFSGAMKQKGYTALRFWREVHGDVAPLAIKKKHVTEFIELLQQRPATLPKGERDIPLRELVERYAGRTDVRRLTKTTVVTHLRTLGTLWNHADERGEIGADEDRKLPNPFEGRKIAQAQPAGEVAQLSKDEIEGIFSLPIFTEGERPGQGRGEAAYWVPLLLLWTGARPEEVAQLRLEDFALDDATGRLMVSITNVGDHEYKGKMRLKTEAKATGRRVFPIPKALIDLGLEDYIEWLKAAGESVLFPRLRPKGARGNLFDSLSRWYVPMLKEKGIIPQGARKPLREFRGNWTTEGRRVGMPRDAREYIQGHSTSAPGTSANEIYGDRSPLGMQIDLITFDWLDLSPVARWRPPSS